MSTKRKMLSKIKSRIKALFQPNMTEAHELLRSTAREVLLSSRRNGHEKSLTRHGYKAFSQSDEDGIIEEIFRRIGADRRVFVELGAGDGLENNTLNLLVKGWSGVWVEGSAASCATASQQFHHPMSEGRLQVLNRFIDKDNVVAILQTAGVPRDFDLLSIDLDGNDYWIWKAIEHYRPRVVVMEYNAEFGPSTEWVMPYDKHHTFQGTCCYGASLKALERLGTELGYSLVGCNVYGINAFFVAANLVGEEFLGPFTAEMHYECPRYDLAPARVRPVDAPRLFTAPEEKSDA